MRSRAAGTAVVLFAAAAIAAGSVARVAHAQQAWVRSEVRLNLRTGPGTQFRIVGVVVTGDEVRVLERGEQWTRIRLADGSNEGWIPGGYLQDDPPPQIRLERVEAELARVRAELEEVTAEAERLRETNATLAARDSEQREEVDRLTQENIEMRAGARVPELIAGASILGLGLIIGAILHRNATRSRPSRIRL